MWERPPLNVLDIELLSELDQALSKCADDSGVDLVVLKGAGARAFSAGVDIRDHTKEKVPEMLQIVHGVVRKLLALPQVTVAAVRGACLGGGCEIALACDIRIIAEDVKIGLPEIKLGVFPGSGGLYRLPKIIGMSNAMEMMYTGDALTAQEAYRIGLVNHVTAPKHALIFAKKLAEKIAQQPKQSLAAIKKGVRKSLEITQEEAIQYNLELSDKVFKTSDCEEGIHAFFEKRAPRFK